MKSTTGPEQPIRIEQVLGFQLPAEGQAFALVIDTSAGAMALEVAPDVQRQLLRCILQALVACAVRQPELPNLGDSDPAESVYLPCVEMQALPVAGAHRRLVLRIGTMDFTALVQSQGDARRIAEGLLLDLPK